MFLEGFVDLDPELLFKILLAVALGAIVGFERELKHRPAGLRTHMLVSLGSVIFTVTSMSFDIEPTRIASGIVTGIGFLGAGSIIALRGHIRGITSAATLWVVASIGLSVGIGEYALAIVSAVIVFGILRIKSVEDKLIHVKDKRPKGYDDF